MAFEQADGQFEHVENRVASLFSSTFSTSFPNGQPLELTECASYKLALVKDDGQFECIENRFAFYSIKVLD